MLFLLCVKIRSEISKRDLSRILGFSTFLSISRFTSPNTFLGVLFPCERVYFVSHENNVLV
ncbi:hypothetical protein LEP1GSC035_3385 [Leptospira noguchii str. 2007001578]|uniref:Uncharacterized protein n=1 Tax=Leptospira noguchii str. 2007001578 TaxID=1049974 RepID=A0ABP2T4R8_9LEPT|nr:hypothetical protein LEP1GSC035_3385 [Leptospira noguchii str. 2007001578]